MPAFLLPLDDTDFPEPISREYKGIPIMIENPVGSVRSGIDLSGNFWEVEMRLDYGFIEDTISMEGEDEGLDCFVNFDVDSEWVFVCRQLTFEGNLDEEKIFLGFRTANQVRQAYAEHYNTRQFLGQIEAMAFDDFMTFLNDYYRPKAAKAARDTVITDDAPRIGPPNFNTTQMFDHTQTGVDNSIGTEQGIPVRKLERSVGFDGEERELLVTDDPTLVVDVLEKVVEFTEVDSEGRAVRNIFMGLPTKTVDGMEFPAEAFAVIVDFESPDLWQILLWESPEEGATPESVNDAVEEFSRALLSPDFQNVAKNRILRAFREVMPMQPVPSILV